MYQADPSRIGSKYFVDLHVAQHARKKGVGKLWLNMEKNIARVRKR